MGEWSSAIAGGISGVLNGVGNILGTHMSNKQSEENIRLNAQYQQQLAEQEFQRNLQMWNMTNRYNSPSAQMQRFADAGLNPHLVYGQGSSGNASSQPSYSRPSADLRFQPASLKFGEMFSQISNAFNLFMNYKQMQANVSQAESVAALNDAKAGEVRQNVINKQMELLYNKLNYNQKQVLFPFQVDMLRQQIVNFEKDSQIKEYTKWQKANEVERYNKYHILPSDPPLFKLINLIGSDLLSGLSNPFSGYTGSDSRYPFLSNNWFRRLFDRGRYTFKTLFTN